MREVRFELPAAEQTAAVRTIFHWQRWPWFLGALLIGLLAWSSWTDYSRLRRGRRVDWILTRTSAVMVVVGLPLLYFIPHLTVWSHRRKNRFVVGEYCYRFLPNHLSATSPLASSEIAWTGFHSVREDERFFFFYLSSQYAVVLPKRALAPEEIVELRAFLKGRFGDRARLDMTSKGT